MGLNRKYYQLPSFDDPQASKENKFISRGHGFTMRLLNFLSTLKVKRHWDKTHGRHNVDQFQVFRYSQRMYLVRCRKDSNEN